MSLLSASLLDVNETGQDSAIECACACVGVFESAQISLRHLDSNFFSCHLCRHRHVLARLEILGK